MWIGFSYIRVSSLVKTVKNLHAFESVMCLLTLVSSRRSILTALGSFRNVLKL
jgi:hypothetical protein